MEAKGLVTKRVHQHYCVQLQGCKASQPPLVWDFTSHSLLNLMEQPVPKEKLNKLTGFRQRCRAPKVHACTAHPSWTCIQEIFVDLANLYSYVYSTFTASWCRESCSSLNLKNMPLDPDKSRMWIAGQLCLTAYKDRALTQWMYDNIFKSGLVSGNLSPEKAAYCWGLFAQILSGQVNPNLLWNSSNHQTLWYAALLPCWNQN